MPVRYFPRTCISQQDEGPLTKRTFLLMKTGPFAECLTAGEDFVRHVVEQSREFLRSFLGPGIHIQNTARTPRKIRGESNYYARTESLSGNLCLLDWTVTKTGSAPTTNHRTPENASSRCAGRCRESKFRTFQTQTRLEDTIADKQTNKALLRRSTQV